MTVEVDEKYLPMTLAGDRMTDEEFIAFCEGYPDFRIETTAEGDILIMPPPHWSTGLRNGEIVAQLRNWARAAKTGVCGSEGSGFVLPNGARRSPDACWISRRQLADKADQDWSGSWRMCPEFVVELKSQTDRVRALREKMNEWIENGAELAWLIDPDRRAVEIYRPNRLPEIRIGIDEIKGEGSIEGFTLDLRSVWDPIEA